jgi:methionine-gamma-lyase
MRYAADSASKIAHWLAANPELAIKVNHPELITDKHLQHTYHRFCSGAGSTFSFVVPGGRDAAFRVIDALQLMKSAVSLGGTESLVCHPASTTHSGVTPEMRQRFGVDEGLIRLSVGLEHPDDLMADLRQALRKAGG